MSLLLGVLDDGHGNLWAASNDGVLRLRKDELTAVAEGRRPRIESVQYGVADGLRSTECNGGVQPAIWRAHDGTLWFSTVKGAASINPSNIRLNRRPPPVVIQTIAADERPLPPASPIRLAAGTHRLEIAYAGLSFLAPKQVRFRYRLDGFDDE